MTPGVGGRRAEGEKRLDFEHRNFRFEKRFRLVDNAFVRPVVWPGATGIIINTSANCACAGPALHARLRACF